ncbi:MAG: ATP-binding cassette domain-containing protein [Proteobacteria bacterium]|nr:ATP-binding cassette domain-containing protein [Pseudomonadota bacterium]
MIQFDSVSKVYGTRLFALNSVNLKVSRSDFLLVTGGSGAGKSTLLRLIYGDIKPTHGSILVSGQAVEELSARKLAYLRRQLGIVFQDFKLLWNRTVLDNVALPIVIWDNKEADPNYMAEKIMKEFDLWKYKDLYPYQLSGGEQQKVSICRALIGDPWVLIADEPTGNLDPLASTEIFDIFKNASKRGRTVIVATHNERSISMHSGRVVRLEKGKLID